jgi:hypothetical protein
MLKPGQTVVERFPGRSPVHQLLAELKKSRKAPRSPDFSLCQVDPTRKL